MSKLWCICPPVPGEVIPGWHLNFLFYLGRTSLCRLWWGSQQYPHKMESKARKNNKQLTQYLYARMVKLFILPLSLTSVCLNPLNYRIYYNLNMLFLNVDFFKRIVTFLEVMPAWPFSLNFFYYND